MTLSRYDRSGGVQVTVESCPFCDAPIAADNTVFPAHLRHSCETVREVFR